MAISVEIKKEYKGHMRTISFQSTSSRIGILGDSAERLHMLLQCITGAELPDTGKISIDGKTMYDSEKEICLKVQERRLGCLFRDYALFPFMTVAQNIACGFRGDKREKKEAVQAYIQRYHLKKAAGKYPHQLSKLEQLYTAIARMMIGEPGLIILEDFFSGWNQKEYDLAAQELQELLANYKGTIVMASQNFREIYEFCEEAAIFCNEEITAVGSVRKLYRNPQTVDAARLLGCRNCSRMERLDERHIYALDWEVVLRTAEQVEEDMTHVGIYAHCLQPLEKERENCLPVQAEQCTKTMTAWKYQVKNRKKKDASAVEWMRPDLCLTDESHSSLPEYLYFPPESLLLLKQ